MNPSSSPARDVRVAILVDVRDESPLTVAIWAHLAAHTLTEQLWDHGVVAHILIEIDDPAPLGDDHATLTDHATTTPAIHDPSR